MLKIVVKKQCDRTDSFLKEYLIKAKAKDLADNFTLMLAIKTEEYVKKYKKR